MAMGKTHLQLQWGKLLWSHLWIHCLFFPSVSNPLRIRMFLQRMGATGG